MNTYYTIKFVFKNNPAIEQEIRDLGEILNWNQDPLMTYIEIKTQDTEKHKALFKKYKDIQSTALDRIDE